MTQITLEAQARRRPEGIVTRVVRGLAATIAERQMNAELEQLEALPSHLLSDMGLPGFHLMTPKARKAAYRAAINRQL